MARAHDKSIVVMEPVLILEFSTDADPLVTIEIAFLFGTMEHQIPIFLFDIAQRRVDHSGLPILIAPLYHNLFTIASAIFLFFHIDIGVEYDIIVKN